MNGTSILKRYRGAKRVVRFVDFEKKHSTWFGMAYAADLRLISNLFWE